MDRFEQFIVATYTHNHTMNLNIRWNRIQTWNSLLLVRTITKRIELKRKINKKRQQHHRKIIKKL